MRDEFIKQLTLRAQTDSDIILITGDLGFSVLDEFRSSFPHQFINAGVAEQNMTMLACGMALDGAKVFTYSIANFTILRCLEQIRNDVAYHDADVTAVSVGGGFSYGQLGMSHFATEDLAIMRALPNMRVIAPSSVDQASRLTDLIISEGGPCYLRLDKDSSGLNVQSPQVQIGKAVTVQNGSDLTFCTTGAILREALVAAETLAKSGISVRILDFHTLKPLDRAAIECAASETGLIITIEEHNTIGGLGSAVSEVVANLGCARVCRIGLEDLFPSIVGDQQYLRSAYNMDAASIVRLSLKYLESK